MEKLKQELKELIDDCCNLRLLTNLLKLLELHK